MFSCRTRADVQLQEQNRSSAAGTEQMFSCRNKTEVQLQEQNRSLAAGTEQIFSCRNRTEVQLQEQNRSSAAGTEQKFSCRNRTDIQLQEQNRCSAAITDKVGQLQKNRNSLVLYKNHTNSDKYVQKKFSTFLTNSPHPPPPQNTKSFCMPQSSPPVDGSRNYCYGRGSAVNQNIKHFGLGTGGV